MTFGSVFGRTFSPTFKPHSQAAAAAGGWWLSGGIAAANCVAAYQAKGAASYAASLTDLSGNSNDATEGVAPTWDSTDGWQFDGVDDYLSCPAVVTDRYGALIIRYSGATTQNNNAGISLKSSSTRRGNFGIQPNSQYGVRYWQRASPKNVLPSLTYGVLAISDFHGYRNGDDNGSWLPSSTGEDNLALSIGRADGWSGIVYTLVNVQAWALYSSPITPTQVGLLTTAMNAL